MKIHTTQNLSSQRSIQPTNVMQTRLGEFSSKPNLRLPYLSEEPDTYDSSSVSFKGSKKVVRGNHKVLREVTSKGKNFVDKILASDSFDKVLDLMGHEVFVQAAMSALICMILRPATIMALPNKDKSKQDNMYASAHSISSGAAGIISSLIISVPFSKGIKYAAKNYTKDLKVEILKEKYPILDIKSIWADEAKGIRKPIEEWLNLDGKKFCPDYKNAVKVALPKHASEISEKTLKEDFNADVDVKANIGKKMSEIVTRDGKKLEDVIDFKQMYIRVEEEGLKDGKVGTLYLPLADAAKGFLEHLFPKLDMKSISQNGERVHYKNWKNIDGSKFEGITIDDIYLSSFKETASAIPYQTGAKRLDSKTGLYKYISYQAGNSVFEDGKLVKAGSKITQDCVDADAINAVEDRVLGWIPDIITRPIVAGGTIAVIPWTLKNVFHIEKSKKKEEEIKPAMKMETDAKLSEAKAKEVV